jgi:acyl-coenzyme A thioesterase PaaI-like protein
LQEAENSPRRWCFGCGDANPESLGIEFEVEGRCVRGRFQARKEHQGFPRLAHGGIAAAAIDEAMGWSMYAAGAWAMTARLEVKYRRPMPLGEPLEVTAEVVRDRGSWLEAEAQIRLVDGPIVAEGKAVFMRLPEDRALEMQEFYLAGRA